MNQYKNCEKISTNMYKEYMFFLKESMATVNESFIRNSISSLREEDRYKYYFGSYSFGICRFGLEQKDNSKKCCPFYSIPNNATNLENRKIFIFNKYNSDEINRLPFCKKYGDCELVDIERQLKVVNEKNFNEFLDYKKIDETKDLLIKLSINQIRQKLINFRTKV